MCENSENEEQKEKESVQKIERFFLNTKIMDNFWTAVLVASLAFTFKKPFENLCIHLSSTKSLLKLGIKLDDFFKSETGYREVVRDIEMLMRDEKPDVKSVRKCLNLLRSSPFFDKKYKPEYDHVWLASQQEGKTLTCKELNVNYEMFWGFIQIPKCIISKPLCNCENKKDHTLKDLLMFLDLKLKN